MVVGDGVGGRTGLGDGSEVGIAVGLGIGLDVSVGVIVGDAEGTQVYVDGRASQHGVPMALDP